MPDHKTLWKLVRKSLKKNQPSHAYSTWFAPIKSIGLNNGKLLLELPNQFFYDWIQAHYIDIIEKTVIDKNSLKIIDGSTVDFKKELIGNSFVINNPKATSSCGCGLSISV